MSSCQGWSIQRWSPASRVAALAMAAMLIGGACTGAEATAVPTPEVTPTPTSTPSPSPSPTPTLISVSDLNAVCKDSPTRVSALASAYGGKSHPLVVVNAETNLGPLDAGFTSNAPFLSGSMNLQLQLVLCLSGEKYVRIGSCGTYRQPNGVTGQVIRYRTTKKVTVIVAKSGKVLQTKVFYGTIISCPPGGLFSGKPPWQSYGPPPTKASIDVYARALRK